MGYGFFGINMPGTGLVLHLNVFLVPAVGFIRDGYIHAENQKSWDFAKNGFPAYCLYAPVRALFLSNVCISVVKRICSIFVVSSIFIITSVSGKSSFFYFNRTGWLYQGVS